MSWHQKRPVVVEARQLLDDLRNHTQIAAWIESRGGHAEIPFAEPCLYIGTLEGQMRAEIGDWIVKGVQGEFYPVKPDIFEATYQPAPEPPALSDDDSEAQAGAAERLAQFALPGDPE